MDFELENIRKAKHLTRRELAFKSGVHVMTITKLENGENNYEEAKISTLISLAKALKCKVRDFYPCEKHI